ncbi:hypothetical protein J6590_077150 [Homalodisca vitripennis]|nr:hypothetical protein J6590_077150 [Homalodisca vitripennis]
MSRQDADARACESTSSIQWCSNNKIEISGSFREKEWKGLISPYQTIQEREEKDSNNTKKGRGRQPKEKSFGQQPETERSWRHVESEQRLTENLLEYTLRVKILGWYQARIVKLSSLNPHSTKVIRFLEESLSIVESLVIETILLTRNTSKISEQKAQLFTADSDDARGCADRGGERTTFSRSHPQPCRPPIGGCSGRH